MPLFSYIISHMKHCSFLEHTHWFGRVFTRDVVMDKSLSEGLQTSQINTVCSPTHACSKLYTDYLLAPLTPIIQEPKQEPLPLAEYTLPLLSWKQQRTKGKKEEKTLSLQKYSKSE